VVLRERETGKHRCICEVCGWKGFRFDTRKQADGQEKNHLIRQHRGAEVWDPKLDSILDVIDAQLEEAAAIDLSVKERIAAIEAEIDAETREMWEQYAGTTFPSL
jgi:hypothetical protein